MEWYPAAMESLRAAAMDAFHRSEPVGEEIAGLLFGRRTRMGWRVMAWRPILPGGSGSSAAPLTNEADATARAILADQLSDIELRLLSPLGWVRSRTRGMAALSPEDVAACQLLFHGKPCIAIILRPSTQKDMTAAFFEVKGEDRPDTSRRGVEASIAPLPFTGSLEESPDVMEKSAGLTEAILAPSETEPVAAATEVTLPAVEERADGRRSRWPIAASVLAAVLATAASIFLFVDRPLRLTVQSEGNSVRLTWNASAGFLTGATGAEIDLSGVARELTLDQVRRGEMLVHDVPGDLSVTFRLRGDYADGQRAAMAVLGVPGARPLN